MPLPGWIYEAVSPGRNSLFYALWMDGVRMDNFMEELLWNL